MKKTFILLIAVASGTISQLKHRLSQAGDQVLASISDNPRTDDSGDKVVNNFNIEMNLPKANAADMSSVFSGIQKTLPPAMVEEHGRIENAEYNSQTNQFKLEKPTV